MQDSLDRQIASAKYQSRAVGICHRLRARLGYAWPATARCDPELLARNALAWYEEHLAEITGQLQNLTAQVENAQLQLEATVKVEVLRHAEYKRLLLLQSDGIVDLQQSTAAGDLLQVVRAEIKTHQIAVRELKAALATFKAELN